MEETLKERTEALCPECLLPLSATISADGDGVVWMERTCPDHGLCARASGPMPITTAG